MRTITRDQLKIMLDQSAPVKLVMALDQASFEQKHIPGSIWVSGPREAQEQLKPEDLIIVYCSHPDCTASLIAYNMLVANGFKHVKRYEGGLADWEGAGLPLEGSEASAG